MADVLIRGMEMPKSCEDCPLVEETENYFGDIMSRVCNLIYKGYTSEATKGRRRDDCPLVPLPEGHGRLIDAERFRVILCRLKERQNDDVATHALNWAIECLDKMDTIVPAEGGDNNEHV